MKYASVVVGIALILAIGGWVYHARQVELVQPVENPLPNPDIGNINPSSTPSTPTTTPTQPPPPSGITLAQVATHGSASSCWSAINGSVYDLTSWIPNHPGGQQPILSLCGKDGSSAFNNQHGGDMRIATILAGFKIGRLQ